MSAPQTMTPTQTTIEFTYQGKQVSLPLLQGTENEVAIDIRNLRAQTGLITFDPGYANSGSCKSAITFIDGEEGILRYRGYPIETLAAKSTFLETAWLLIHGELPSAPELESFRAEITRHTLLHENFARFFSALPKDAHPMPVCAAAVAAMATFYQEPESDDTIHKTVIRLLAKMPTIAAYSYKHYIGQPNIYPQNDLDYCTNFLRMMFATPCEEYQVDPLAAKALDLLLILHADHEQNCSTSTVRMVGSSQANLFASISSGISALWGPLHGGANQKVIEMLHWIANNDGNADRFVTRAKDKNDTTRLMGFGHRVYKNFDPRAKIIKAAADKVLARLNINDPLLEVAKRLEEAALKDEYFVQRKLYPNVDFYSGIIYRALGFPTDMFTVLFAIGRMPGWIAHWREMIEDSGTKIARPRQIYTGPALNHYVSMDERA